MSQHFVVRTVERADAKVIDDLRGAGVATAHEAAGRIGLLGSELLPRLPGAVIAGSAITVSCHAGDNLMIHAAVEQCQPGDVLVVSTTAPSTHGMFGDLLATSLQARGVVGLVIDAGVRDIATLRELRFPVWSRVVHAQGTVKATPGSVNVPIVCAGAIVNPGDVIIADDDGVMCVPRSDAAAIRDASLARLANEDSKRSALASGILGLDLYDLRPLLADLGVQYVDTLPTEPQ
jgi:4-hydroxy-4-methyl-2-oxoglutarate aldolase